MTVRVRRFFHSNPPSATSVADPPSTPPAPASSQDPPAAPPDPTATPPGDDKPPRTYTDAEVQDIVRKRLEQEKRQRDTAAEQARQQAEEAALAEQQKWQELATTRQTRIAELEPLQGQLEETRKQLEQANDALKRVVKAQTEALPEPVRALLSELSPVKQVEWLAANLQTVTATPPPPPATPAPRDDPKGLTEAEIARRKQATKEQVRSMF